MRAKATGQRLSVATIGRALHRLGFTRKKSLVPAERDRPSVIASRASRTGLVTPWTAELQPTAATMNCRT
jgi:hypothetical protein